MISLLLFSSKYFSSLFYDLILGFELFRGGFISIQMHVYVCIHPVIDIQLNIIVQRMHSDCSNPVKFASVTDLIEWLSVHQVAPQRRIAYSAGDAGLIPMDDPLRRKWQLTCILVLWKYQWTGETWWTTVHWVAKESYTT